MNLNNITPLVLTYNESPNIRRTLNSLQWASEIIIIDSFSDDDTLKILEIDPKVRVIQRKFDDHTSQWNFGLEHVKTKWVLSADADYVFTKELVREIETLKEEDLIDGYFIPFKYCVFGKALKGTILPPRQALFKKLCSRYIKDGHTQLLEVDGQSENLKNYILHDDRKPLSRWLWAQDKYMIIEAEKLYNTSSAELSFGDKIRKKIFFAPFVIFFYCLIMKRGILDGYRGWFYAFQRTFAELLLSMRLIGKQINENSIK